MGWAGVLAIALAPLAAGRDARPLTADRLRADLRLEVSPAKLGPVQAGTRVWPTATLVNTSPTVGHLVVVPSGGSEVGWREPHVYWTATIDRGDGKPVPVPEDRYARCGHFDSDWQKDVVRLGPGGRLPLGWLYPPLIDFQQAGRVQLRAHYSYRGTGGKRADPLPPARLGRMAGVPAFEIVSDPLVFEVVRPLDVRVTVKRPLKAKQEVRLSDLLVVQLVNRSGEPVECSSPTLSGDARLRLEIEARYGWHPELDSRSAGGGVRRKLAPGGAVPLLGPGEFPNGLDGRWVYPAPGTVKVRAIYTTSTWTPGAWVASDWVEVTVEK